MVQLRASRFLPLVAAAVLLSALPAAAQTAPPDPIPVAGPIPEEIDLNLINLPTTKSLVRNKGYFRLTHRFAADLRGGSFGELASDLFTIDRGAVIGLEYRHAITNTVHAGIHRSLLSKTIQTFVKWDAFRQGGALPVSLSLTGSVEGLNNLREHRQAGVAVTVSHTFGDRLALYATPAFVSGTHAVDFIEAHDDHDHDTGLEEDEHATHDDTWFAGIGGRLRFSQGGYITAEYTPRLHGYDPNRGEWGVGIEKRTGGHTLQLNITNSFGTTLGQLARGGSPHDIYLGFNITRRF